MYIIDQYFFARIHQHLDNKTFDYFFPSTSLAHFVLSIGKVVSYRYTKLTYLACLVFCYNFRT